MKVTLKKVQRLFLLTSVKKKRLSISDDLPVTHIIHDLPENENFARMTTKL
jgi:hypothetical protein